MALSRVSRLLLTALAPEPLHGYGIIRSVEATTKGRTRLAVGTVYGAIDRLERDGLIQFDHEAIENGRARKYYCLTEVGRSELLTTLENLKQETSAGWTSLGLNEPTLGKPGMA